MLKCFPGGSGLKNLPTNAGSVVQSLIAPSKINLAHLVIMDITRHGYFKEDEF